MLVAIIVLGILLAVFALLFFMLRRDVRRLRLDMLRRLRDSSPMALSSASSNREVVHLVNVSNELFRQKETIALEARQLQQKTRENIANISHDLRTPLTAIMGYCALMNKVDLSGDSLEYVQIIHSKSQLLHRLVDDFYEYSRIINGDYPIELQPLDIAVLLKETLFSYYDEFSAAGAELALDIPDSLITACTDADALGRILHNLISNMLRHGQGDNHIRLWRDDHTARLTLQNKAEGLTEADLGRLFDRSYTVGASRTRGSTGLGLAIAQELALLLGHRLHCQLAGSQFTMTLSMPLNEIKKQASTH